MAAKAAGPLPGGYAVGEKVFFAAGGETFASGDKVTHGQAGEVKGGASDGDPNHVVIKFPGNADPIEAHLCMFSRTPPPPLPGGYAVGEKVYFTGESQTFASGNKVTRGHEGEVTGYPKTDSPVFGKGVAVKFPGNNGNIGCYLTELSRSKPIEALVVEFQAAEEAQPPRRPYQPSWASHASSAGRISRGPRDAQVMSRLFIVSKNLARGENTYC